MNKMSLIQSIHYLLIAILLQSMMCSCSHSAITPNAQSNKPVALFPDYTGVTFPCNIAPPNFRITEEGEAYYTEIGSGNRTFITVRSQASSVILPPDKWEKLLKQAAGSSIYIRICILQHYILLSHRSLSDVPTYLSGL